MEQRTYRGGTATVDKLADFVVQNYAQGDHLRAQKLGEGNSLIVQIGRSGDHHDEHALTLGFHHGAENDADIVVTLGEQQWLDPSMIAYSAMMGLVAVIVTPWALFGLIWPLKGLWDRHELPQHVWSLIETYLVGQGATQVQAQELAHPHAAA